MQFCSECHNMYYLKIQDKDGKIGDTLIYYCRNCGHEDTTLSTTNICVSDIQLRSSEKKYTHIVNEYTKYDPTLPRINTIKCPNQDCTSNAKSKEEKPEDQATLSNREVIYIRYDDINMKYVYLCVHCDTTWRTDNRL